MPSSLLRFGVHICKISWSESAIDCLLGTTLDEDYYKFKYSRMVAIYVNAETSSYLPAVALHDTTLMPFEGNNTSNSWHVDDRTDILP